MGLIRMTNLYLVLFDEKLRVFRSSIKNERLYVHEAFSIATIYPKWTLFDVVVPPYLIVSYFL